MNEQRQKYVCTQHLFPSFTRIQLSNPATAVLYELTSLYIAEPLNPMAWRTLSFHVQVEPGNVSEEEKVYGDIDMSS